MRSLSVRSDSYAFHINLFHHSAVHHFALLPHCILLLSNIPFLLPSQSPKRPSPSPLSSFITKPSHLPPTHPLPPSPHSTLASSLRQHCPSHHRLIGVLILFACVLSFLLHAYTCSPSLITLLPFLSSCTITSLTLPASQTYYFFICTLTVSSKYPITEIHAHSILYGLIFHFPLLEVASGTYYPFSDIY